MTYEDIMESSNRTREEKLVATYRCHPERLSRGIFSLIDAIVHAAPDLKQRIARGVPEYAIAVAQMNTTDLEV